MQNKTFGIDKMWDELKFMVIFKVFWLETCKFYLLINTDTHTKNKVLMFSYYDLMKGDHVSLFYN